MKVLVIRFSSIGDIVLTTPVVRCIKNQIPNVQVHYLTKYSFKAVTEYNPYVDQFFYYKNSIAELIRELKKEKYDYVVDLHKNFRSYRIRMSLQTRVLTYKKESIRKFLLTRFRINIMRERHIVLRNLDAVRRLGVTDDGGGLDYFISQKEQLKNSDIPASHSMGYVAFVIGGSYFTKKLPIIKMKEICRELKYPLILIGDTDDAIEGSVIAEVDPVKIYNACGKFTINESADIVRNAKLVISHDTGLQYIASAFNKTTIAIWGGTSPRLDVEPFYGERFLSRQTQLPYENVIVDTLSCQPCSNFGLAKCPLGHFRCMRDQDVLKIVAIAHNRLNIK
ncbi:MAG TPA: glycosyltransferase family 9 protein [Puia sp.]|nr:glycosyltransferase family 9 protein [Puia sp.]